MILFPVLFVTLTFGVEGVSSELTISEDLTGFSINATIQEAEKGGEKSQFLGYEWHDL